MSEKFNIKTLLESSPLASNVAASTYFRILGILAWRHRLAHLFRCHIALSAKIIGWANCKFGENCVIGARTWINVNHRKTDLIAVEIGKNTFIGQDNFFTSGSSIKIGSYCLTASRCAFIGSSHVIEDPLKFYVTTGVSDKDKITVGTNCFFGYDSTVLGNVEIGHGSIIGAKSVVRENIPPFSLAIGNPAKVVKHYDFEASKWMPGQRPECKTATIPNEREYLEKLATHGKYPIQPISAATSWLSDI